MPEAPIDEAAANAARRTGILCSLGAYLMWGAFPIYFRALRAPPLEILAHRVVWSALFLGLVLAAQRRVRGLLSAARSPRVLLGSFLSASLLAVNWFVYIWAVAEQRVVDASLGYFITPLVSVVLGVLLLGERLRPGQRLAVATAAGGVLWLTLQFGELPWVGLTLALTFGSYGALRKTSALGPLDGLMLEQLLMWPFAAAYLGWLLSAGHSAFWAGSRGAELALVATGPLSSVPLLLFAAGARRIPLSLIGVLQYVSPTISLLLGVLLWLEPFGQMKLVGYALIWFALVIYSLEGVWSSKDRRRAGLVT